MTLRIESFHVTIQLQNFILTFFIQTCMCSHNTHTEQSNTCKPTFLLVLFIGEICPSLCVRDEYWRWIIRSPRSDATPDGNVPNFGSPYLYYIPDRTLTLKIKRVFFKPLIYLPDEVVQVQMRLSKFSSIWAILSRLCESHSRARFCAGDTEPLNSLIVGVLQVFQSRQRTTQTKSFPFSTESRYFIPNFNNT
jgi:hypothetical protein